MSVEGKKKLQFNIRSHFISFRFRHIFFSADNSNLILNKIYNSKSRLSFLLILSLLFMERAFHICCWMRSVGSSAIAFHGDSNDSTHTHTLHSQIQTHTQFSIKTLLLQIDSFSNYLGCERRTIISHFERMSERARARAPQKNHFICYIFSSPNAFAVFNQFLARTKDLFSLLFVVQ